MRERVWLAYPPAYLGSFRSASKSNMAVKMTTAFAFLKNSGCPIYLSHHPWECKLHEKGSSHAEGGEGRRKACLSAFQRLVLHSAGSHPKWHLHASFKSLRQKWGHQMPAATDSWGGKERVSF